MALDPLMIVLLEKDRIHEDIQIVSTNPDIIFPVSRLSLRSTAADDFTGHVV
jgi:hypothetical protein